MPRKYITQHMGGKGYTSPLHKFIDFTGRNYGTMTRKEIYAVGDLKQYKEWKRHQRIKKMVDRQQKLKESQQKYKHIDPTHIARKKLITTLMAQGFSPEKQSITATKQTKFGRAKPRVGKRAYQPIRTGFAKFRQITFDPNKKGRTKTVRLLKKHKEYVGKVARQLISSGYEYDAEYLNQILEAQPMTYDEKVDRTISEPKIDKIVSKNRELKDKEYKISNTQTGKSARDTNTIIVNPTQYSGQPKK